MQPDSPPPSTDAAGAEPLLVLLVEDDPGDALLAREALSHSDSQIEIVWERTLADAIEQLRQTRVVCVLLDLGLPDSIGVQTIESIREFNVPIIVLSGYDDDRRRDDALRAGAADYYVKGEVDRSQLLAAIRSAVSRAGPVAP